MGKSDITLIICFFFIVFTSCKENKKEIKLVGSAKNIKIQEEFDQINFSIFNNYQNALKSLDLKFENINFKIKLVEDRSYIKYLTKEKQISDWQQISYNHSYDNSFENAQKEIRILYNSNNQKGFLLLPGYTEEYPVFNVYEFDSSGILYLQNIRVDKNNCNITEQTKIKAIKKNNHVSFRFSASNHQDNKCNLINEPKDRISKQFEKEDLYFINKGQSLNTGNIISISDGEYFIDDKIQNYEISLNIKKDSVIYTEIGNMGKTYNQYVLSKKESKNGKLLLKYLKTLEGFTDGANKTTQFGIVSGQDNKIYLTGNYVENRYNIQKMVLKKER